MSSRTVSVVLTAQVSNYLSNMRAAEERTLEVERAARTATQQFRAHQDALHAVGVGMLAVGGLAAAGMAVAVKASAEFGAKMAQLQSLSHASAGSMRQMSDAAMSVGAAYGFTATQVADAEIELQKAGVGVAAQLGGALKGALSLAAAGQLDVAQATEITTVAMTQFGLSAEDVPHLADLLAAGADKALGSVGDLGEALKNGGLQAHNMGMSIDDTVGLLSAFANAGILGAEAGTQMRSMFLRIQNPVKAARDMLAEHNIALNDAGGHFVGVAKLGDELRAGLGKLTDAERNHALAVIFGSHAITGATVLYQDSGAAAAKAGLSIADWTKAVQSAGFADAQASGKMNSLTGDVQKLSAAFQNDLIKAGNAADGPLRGLTQTATGLVTALGEIPAPVASGVMAAGALVAAVGLVGGAMLIAVPRIALMRQSLKELGISGGQAAGMIGTGSKLLIGVAAISSGLAAAGTHGMAGAEDMAKAADTITGRFKNLDAQFAKGDFFTGIRSARDALEQSYGGSSSDAGIAKAVDAWTGSVMNVSATWRANEATFNAIGQQLGSLAQKGNYQGATEGFNQLVKSLGGGADVLHELQAATGDYRSAIVNQLHESKVQVTEQNILNAEQGKGAAGAKLLAAAQTAAAKAAATQQTGLNRLAGSAVTAKVDIGNLQKAIEGFGSAQLDARGATRAFYQAVDDADAAVKKNGRTLDVHTQKGRDNQAALDAIASSADAAAGKILKETGSTAKAAAAMQKGRDEYIRVAEAMGLSKDAAARLADQLQLIPANVRTAVSVTGVGDALTQVGTVLGKLRGLDGKSATVAVHYQADGSAFQVHTGGGTPLILRAAGGPIDGPGQKGVDSVPAVLAPGEHVLTAGDVDRLGGQGGAYRFRAALAAGEVQAFAKGGAVKGKTPKSIHLGETKAKAPKGTAKVKPFGGIWDQQYKAANAKADQDAAERSLDDSRARLKRQEKAAADAEKALGKARDAAASITGKGSAGRKRAAEANVRRISNAAKADAARVKATTKKVAADTKARDDAKQRRSDALAAAAQLGQGREDFVSAERRNPNRATEDPLGYVDQARTMSRDLALSPTRRKALDAAANKYEGELVRLTKSSADAATKLADLRQQSEQLRSSTRSAIAGGYTLGGAAAQQTASGWIVRDGMRFQTTSSGPTAASIGAYYRQGAGDAAAFAEQLRQLAGRGIPGELLAQLAGMGTEAGSPIAQALLSASPSELADIGGNFAAIGSAADLAGGTVADANYAAQIADADANANRITEQIKTDGEALRKLIARAFGLSGYAVGTDAATPGIHLVGEQGPELVGFRGGEKVLTAAQSARWIRGTAGPSNGGGVMRVQVAMPTSMDLVDAGSGVISTMRVVARDVAVQEIAVDALHDAVLMSGGAA